MAINKRHLNFVTELIASGADVNTGSQPVLIKSVTLGNIQCVKMILKAGADINTRDENGNTALIKAANDGNESIVQLLLKEGAKVNIKNNIGKTALYCAVINGHTAFEESQSKDPSTDNSFQLSKFARIVYALLQAGGSIE